MTCESPVCNRVAGAGVVTAQAIRAVFAPLRAAVDHGDIIVGALAGTESAARAGVGSMEFCCLHQAVEEPWIDNAAQESGAGAEGEVYGLLTCEDTRRDGLHALARGFEFAAFALFGVDVHEGHADVAQRHDDGVYAADNAIALGDQAAPLAVDMTRFASAGANHVNVFAVEVGVIKRFDYYWRNSPGVDREDPYMIGKIFGEQL